MRRSMAPVQQHQQGGARSRASQNGRKGAGGVFGAFDKKSLAEDEEQDIEQKESMSKQMTEILLDRVARLKGVFSEANETLLLDVDPGTDTCTSSFQETRAKELRSRSAIDLDAQVDPVQLAQLQRPNPSRTFTIKQLFREGHVAKAAASVQQQEVIEEENERDSDSTRGEDSPALSSSEGAAAHEQQQQQQQQQQQAAASIKGKGSRVVGRGVGGGKLGVSASAPDLGGAAAAADARHPSFSSMSRERMLLERELHTIAEMQVTRSVENIGFSYKRPTPFDTKARLMLGYVHVQICLPRHENIQGSFAKVLFSPLVGQIYDSLYWYNLCLHFIKSRTEAALELVPRDKHKRAALLATSEATAEDLAMLRADLSRLYISLVRLFRRVPALKRDHIHRYLPFAVANAILQGFRYLCPGSRHLYTKSVQAKVYETCCELLLGTTVSPSSINITRGKLFPLESKSSFLNDDGKGGDGGGSASDKSSGGGRGGRGRRSNQHEDGGGSSEPAREGDSPSGADDGDSDGSEGGWDALDRSMFQVRDRYDSMHVGSLLKEYICRENGLKNKKVVRPGTAPAHIVRRTMPTANSRVGGINTFRRTQTREHMVAEITDKYDKQREEYQTFVQKSRALLRSRMQVVTDRRNNVLRGGVAHVSRFCTDLAQRDPDQQDYHKLHHSSDAAGDDADGADPATNAAAGPAASAAAAADNSRRRKQPTPDDNISGESKGVRNKHLQGDQKLDWHANLAVHINLPPASRVIAAMEKIEASKKSDRQKPRTKARFVLCGLKNE